jgi:GxxExxY protein
MNINELTSKVIGVAIEVHKELGPGLFESVYEKCVIIALEDAGLRVECQVPVKVHFRGHDLEDDAFRADLVIEGVLVVELKSVEKISPVNEKQLLTYLRLMKKEVGLLMNFNEKVLKSGVRRIVNNYQGDAS